MEIVTVFKALADSNRLRIVAALLDHEELCACQLTELLGVTGATASRHLSQLQRSGLLESRKQGRWVLYRLQKRLPLDLPLAWLRGMVNNDDGMREDMKKLEEILRVDPEIICRRQRNSAIKERQ